MIPGLGWGKYNVSLWNIRLCQKTKKCSNADGNFSQEDWRVLLLVTNRQLGAYSASAEKYFKKLIHREKH